MASALRVASERMVMIISCMRMNGRVDLQGRYHQQCVTVNLCSSGVVAKFALSSRESGLIGFVQAKELKWGQRMRKLELKWWERSTRRSLNGKLAGWERLGVGESSEPQSRCWVDSESRFWAMGRSFRSLKTYEGITTLVLSSRSSHKQSNCTTLWLSTTTWQGEI